MKTKRSNWHPRFKLVNIQWVSNWHLS